MVARRMGRASFALFVVIALVGLFAWSAAGTFTRISHGTPSLGPVTAPAANGAPEPARAAGKSTSTTATDSGAAGPGAGGVTQSSQSAAAGHPPPLARAAQPKDAGPDVVSPAQAGTSRCFPKQCWRP
jgi:hypothetical protein